MIFIDFYVDKSYNKYICFSFGRVESVKRPNIVFAFLDDWGRYASCYAEHEGPKSLNTLIQTPHLDRVAHEGVLFKNALVPAPTCTPCRSSVLSGRYFWECGMGAILQGAKWDMNIPSYPLLLEDAGYHIGYTYKVWAPGQTENAPYGAERTRYEDHGKSYMNFSIMASAWMKSESIPVDEAKDRLYEETRQNFRDFMKARPENDQPFCYWWGSGNTHRWWEKGSGQALWGLDPDALKGKIPAFLPDVHEVREDVNDYLGECLAVDAGVGVLLEELEAAGELDNTLFVVSGDHGIPGFPRAKCNLYDIGCEVALMARWPGHIESGRVVDDMVNLMDLAPTFLEAAGETPPACMSAKSLLPLLESKASGQVDPERDHVVVGRERHVAMAREDGLPYPQRAIRTQTHLYITNFEPERWPMGDPRGLDKPETIPPSVEELEADTMVAYSDLDASPTKAWMIHHRNDEAVKTPFELGFGKRVGEELYDLRVDPDYMNNLAADESHADLKAELRSRLLQTCREHEDPRLVESPCRFESAPYAGPLE